MTLFLSFSYLLQLRCLIFTHTDDDNDDSNNNHIIKFNTSYYKYIDSMKFNTLEMLMKSMNSKLKFLHVNITPSRCELS
jgi:hypothetical protein